MAGIDRRKHDIDVIERVLGGLLEESTPAEVVSPGIPSTPAGLPTTAVQISVGTMQEREKAGQPRPARGDDEYESDRRGEHSYPGDGKGGPPSHRERDDLKSRLERRG